MRLEDIGFYTLSDDRAKQASAASPLWRCELLLTDQCNFKCPYCRGVRGDIKGTLSLERAKSVVECWASHGLKNIRFSGGEPTMWPNLKELCTYAKILGIERIAVSSNGSAEITTYERLIESGVNDFSISLDACCASFGDKMSGVSGKWGRVIETIEYLAGRTYVTCGVVLTQDNLPELEKIITFAHNLGVADIRIISAAQFNELNFINVPPGILDSHKILKYRLNNLKSKRGVRGITSSDCSKCSLVLDDMAVAGNYHFPCIIYLREGGDPIGTVDNKSMEEIREERKLWMERTDTSKCHICKNNCLDVCVDYNNRVAEVKQ